MTIYEILKTENEGDAFEAGMYWINQPAPTADIDGGCLEPGDAGCLTVQKQLKDGYADHINPLSVSGRKNAKLPITFLRKILAK